MNDHILHARYIIRSRFTEHDIPNGTPPYTHCVRIIKQCSSIQGFIYYELYRYSCNTNTHIFIYIYIYILVLSNFLKSKSQYRISIIRHKYQYRISIIRQLYQYRISIIR